jgi:glyoxylase-like metal-dependent hydrolase (beta-lactamase superfamily II)
MVDDIPFDRHFDVPPGRVETVAPLVRRIVAPNPGPFTFTGTCTYIVGEGEVAIIDPGPDLPAHTRALLDAVKGETVAQIMITHTHRDHSPAAQAIRAATGAPTFGDMEFMPDVRLRDGEMIAGKGYTLETVLTPGHTMNHAAFALQGTDILFSGDHVMAWSTSIVAPPDGEMHAYMDSLRKLKRRPETVYFPGHGPAVRNAPAFVDRYIAHRDARETAILRSLERGETDIPSLVRAIYIGINPKLAGAAALMTFAQLEDLVARKKVVADSGVPSLASRFRLA